MGPNWTVRVHVIRCGERGVREGPETHELHLNEKEGESHAREGRGTFQRSRRQGRRGSCLGEPEADVGGKCQMAEGRVDTWTLTGAKAHVGTGPCLSPAGATGPQRTQCCGQRLGLRFRAFELNARKTAGACQKDPDSSVDRPWDEKAGSNEGDCGGSPRNMINPPHLSYVDRCLCKSTEHKSTLS